MGEFDPRFSRLKILIILVLFYSFMITCEVVFITGTTVQNPFEGEVIVPAEYEEKNVSILATGEVITTVISYMTFTLPEIDTWMMVIIAPIMSICFLIIVYLIIDIAYSWIKALPFT